MEQYISMITTVGFPIAACVAMGGFIWKVYNKMNDNNKDRENKLYETIGKQSSLMTDLANTNAKLAMVISEIKEDIETIKDELQDMNKKE